MVCQIPSRLRPVGNRQRGGAGAVFGRRYSQRVSALHGVLQRRRRPVLLTERVARTWIEKYAPRRIIRKRSAAAVWGTAGESSEKRLKVSTVELVGAAAVEDACGERYRREVSDLGLGERFFVVRYSFSSIFVLCFLFFLFISKIFYSLYNLRHPLLRKVALPSV